jgi:hypothetical protein
MRHGDQSRFMLRSLVGVMVQPLYQTSSFVATPLVCPTGSVWRVSHHAHGPDSDDVRGRIGKGRRGANNRAAGAVKLGRSPCQTSAPDGKGGAALAAHDIGDSMAGRSRRIIPYEDL